MGVLIFFILIGGFVAFMVADALIDWLFIASYALLAALALNNVVHLSKYYKKYKSICASDIGKILLYICIAAFVVFLNLNYG